MDKAHLLNTISKARFEKYLNASNYDLDLALVIYKKNIAISKEFYTIIGLFEVALRNTIDSYFSFLHGSEWLVTAIKPGGYLSISNNCEHSRNTVLTALNQLGSGYTKENLLTKLSFGFWTYQFASKEFRASGSTLLNIFPDKPFRTNQKIIFKNLIRINLLRNRIAHYEPICFEKLSGRLSVQMIRSKYDMVVDMLSWMGYELDSLFEGKLTLLNDINFIQQIAKRNN